MAKVDNGKYQDNDIKRIFTYGMLTLDPERHEFNFQNEKLAAIEGLRKIGFPTRSQCFYIVQQQGYRVIGATYDATPELLQKLDRWEDHAYTPMPVTTTDGELAWAYIGTEKDYMVSRYQARILGD